MSNVKKIVVQSTTRQEITATEIQINNNSSNDRGIIGQGIRCSGNGIPNTGLKWYLKTT